MKLEDQVISLELARQLKELGFEQGKSLFIIRRDGGHIILNKTNEWDGNREHYYSAYTVAELGEMLPEGFNSIYLKILKGFRVSNDEGELAIKYGIMPKVDKTEANARAKMLVYLKENKLI